MNSKGHLTSSLIKSAIRIAAGGVSFASKSVYPLAAGIVIAEVFGVAEELFDKR